MGVELKSRDHLFQVSFPHPVAAPYRVAATSCSPVDALVHLTATVDGLARYLVTILMSDRLRRTGDLPQGLQEQLSIPTITGWIEAAGALLASEPGAPWFIAELSDGKTLEALAALKELAAETDKLFESSDSLNPDLAGTRLETLRPMVLDVLSGFGFLADYPLGQIHEQGPADGARGFHGVFKRWMGYQAQALPISINLEKRPPLAQVVLSSPGMDGFLSLEPLASLPEAGDELFLFSGFYSATELRLSCNRSGNIRSLALEFAGELKTLTSYFLTLEQTDTTQMGPSRDTIARMGSFSRLLPEGEVLDGRFTNLGFLGRGGIGAVYRLLDNATDEELAVKVLYPDLSRNEFFTRYFLETGRWLSQVRNDSLVPVREAFYSPELYQNHILMEYMPGGSLGERLDRRGLLPVVEALEILIPLLDGLDFIHGQGRLHGALNPNNVLFDKDGRPRLGDFGIFRLSSDQISTFRPIERIQSIAYAAPELTLGSDLSPLVDVYSAGVLLYRMITGKLPDRLNYRRASELVGDLPEGLDDILGRALAMRAAGRPATAGALKKDLEKLLENLDPRFRVIPTADAQRVWYFLGDISAGYRRDDLSMLEVSLAEQDWEMAVGSLKSLADQVWTPGEKIRYMMAMGDILMNHMGQAEEAVSIYRTCLSWEPGNQTVLDKLGDYLRDAERWEELLDLLEDAPSSLDRLQEMSEIAVDRLDAPSRAADYLQRIGRMLPGEPVWLEKAAELKQQAGDWRGAYSILESLVARNREGSVERVRYLRVMAPILEARIHDPRAAVACWEEILRTNPGDSEAVASLRSLYKATFSYAALVDLLEAMLDQGDGDGELTLSILHDLGELYSSYLYDKTKAAAIWNRVLKLEPDNMPALSYLERLYLREGDYQSYMDILLRKAEALTEPREKADVLLTAARTQSQVFQDLQGSRNLLQKALGMAPGHPGVEAALEQMYQEHGFEEALADLLLSRLETCDNPRERQDILAKLAEAFDKGLGDPASSLQVLQKMLVEYPDTPRYLTEALLKARSYEGGPRDLHRFLVENADRQGTKTRVLWLRRAFELSREAGIPGTERVELLERILELDSSLAGLRSEFTEIYRDLEDWDALGDAIITQMSGLEDGPRLDDLVGELVVLCRDRLTDMEKASAICRRAMELAPGAVELRPLYWEILNKGGLHDQLADLLLEEAEKGETMEIRQQSRIQLGETLRLAGRFDESIEWLTKAFHSDIHDERVHELTCRVLSEAGDWEGLLGFYLKISAFTQNRVARLSYLDKAAAIQSQVFDRHEDAAHLYRQLIHMDPDRIEYYDALEGELVELGRDTELVWVLEEKARHQVPEDQIASYRRISQLHAEVLENVDAGIASLRKALEIAPQDAGLLEELRQLCTRHERWSQFLKALRGLLSSLDGLARVPVLVEMARIAFQKMEIAQNARKFITQAMELDPGSDEAFEVATEIMAELEDWKGMVQLLEKRMHASFSDSEQEELGLRLARVNATKLGREVDAIKTLERVLEINPENLDAAVFLAQLYVKRQDWGKAAPLFLMIHSANIELEPDKKLEMLLLTGRTYEGMLDRVTAIDYYSKVLELDRHNLEARMKLANLYYLEGRWDDVTTYAQGLIDDHRVQDEDTRRLRNMLADVERRLGKDQLSQSGLERMLSATPSDTDVLGRLVKVYLKEGDLKRARSHLERYLQLETDPEARFEFFLKQADLELTLEESGFLDRAIRALRSASEIHPDSKAAWIKLSEVALRRESFDEALVALAMVEKVEPDPVTRGATAMSQGVILADYLQEQDKAVAHFQRALEHDPNRLEAFQRLEKLAVEKGDWELQRDIYQKMLDRLGKDGPRNVRLTLHQNLAAIALEKLGDEVLAQNHLEYAVRLDSSDMKSRERLAAIYSNGDEKERAITLYQTLLRTTPRNPEYLRQLRKLFSAMKYHDKAWCATAALVLQGEASEKEVQFYERFRSNALKLKSVVMNHQNWAEEVVSAEEDWDLSEVMRLLYITIGPRLALAPAKGTGFSRKELLDGTNAKTLSAVVSAVSQVFGVETPQVYLREGVIGLDKIPSMPPVMAAGQDMMDGKKGKELRFHVGRSISLFLHHHALVGVMDKDGLMSLVLNAMKFMYPSMPEPPGDPKVNMILRKEMGTSFTPAVHSELKARISRLRRKGGEISLSKWLTGVEKTSARAGLAICNDLPTVGQIISEGYRPFGKITADELLEDIISYSVSEAYFKLRTRLGISIM